MLKVNTTCFYMDLAAISFSLKYIQPKTLQNNPLEVKICWIKPLWIQVVRFFRGYLGLKFEWIFWRTLPISVCMQETPRKKIVIKLFSIWKAEDLGFDGKTWAVGSREKEFEFRELSIGFAIQKVLRQSGFCKQMFLFLCSLHYFCVNFRGSYEIRKKRIWEIFPEKRFFVISFWHTEN